MIRHYYTLNELFTTFNLSSVQTLVTAKAQSALTLDAKFAQVINVLKDRYGKWYVGYIDSFKPTETEIDELKDDFIKKLSVIYNFTEKRYLCLLTLYGAQESNLMNQLNSVESITGSRRVNDTPQDAGTGHSNFEDDDHTSLWEGNDSTRTTTSDPATVMERLNEIQNKYMNLIKGWCDEFAKLFITPNREYTIPEGE